MALLKPVQAALDLNPIFKGCEAEVLGVILKNYPKGSEVSTLCGGEPAIGLVVEGRVAVYSLCADGTSVHLTAHHPGDCFGIASIFTEKPVHTLLVCERTTCVAYITRETFMTLLRTDPAVFIRYGRLCNEKIDFLTQKIEFLTLPTCRSRLCSFLLQTENRDGAVHLTMSKEQLARILGVSRASLYRELGLMRNEGLIAVQGRTIRLCNPAALKHHVSQGA